MRRFSTARMTPSFVWMPTAVDPSLIASIAYSTCWSLRDDPILNFKWRSGALVCSRASVIDDHKLTTAVSVDYDETSQWRSLDRTFAQSKRSSMAKRKQHLRALRYPNPRQATKFTWKSRPSGEKVFTPRSYSLLRIVREQ